MAPGYFNSNINPFMYNMNTCFFNNNYDYSNGFNTGSMVAVGSIFTALAVTKTVVSANKEAKAERQKVYEAAEKAVADALEEMPSGYNTKETYKTDIDSMTGISAITDYKAQESKVSSLDAEVKALSSKNDAEDDATIASYDKANSELSQLQLSYDNLCKQTSPNNETKKKIGELANKIDEKKKEVIELESKKKTAEANKAKRKELADAQAELKKLEPAYTSKKNKIKAAQGKVTEAINKLNKLDVQKKSNNEKQIFDKADGNIVSRNNPLAPKTSKARTTAGEFFAKLNKYRTNNNGENKKAAITAYNNFKAAFDALKDPSDSLHEAMKMANTSYENELS